MKKCPYCAEEIQNDAIKCRYCGEWAKEIETIIPEIIDLEPSTHPKAEVKDAEPSIHPPKYEKLVHILKRSRTPLFIMIGGYLYNFVFYIVLNVKFFDKILTIPYFVESATLVFGLTFLNSLFIFLILFIVKLFKKQRPSFFIPSLIISLLTFATISLGLYETYYEKYGHDFGQKQEKTDDTLREETTSKDNSDIKTFTDPDYYISKDAPDPYAYMEDSDKFIPKDTADGYNSSGDAYYRSGDIDRACEEWRKACMLGVCRGLDRAMEKGICQQQDKTDKTVGEKITLKDPKDSDAYSNQGVAHYELGQHQKAIEDFNQAISLDPKDARAYKNRGIIYGELGQYQKAIEDYKQTIRLNPKDANAYDNLGFAYYKLGQYQKAIEYYNQAISLDPVVAGAFNRRGLAYNNIGQYQRAIEDCNQAIKLDRNNALAYYNRGLAYYGKEQFDKAIADYTRAIEINPKYADAYFTRGVSYDEKEQFDKAIADYTRAIEINPKYADAYYNRGLAYGELKKYNKAIEDYNKAISLAPKDANAYVSRGVAYNKLGQYQRAIDDFDQVIHLNPKDANAFYNLGCIYSLQDNISKAVKYLELALENGYDNFDWISKDTDWDNIRSTKEFNELIGKHKK